MRHTHSTRLKEEGTPADVRQKLLDHANMPTTENTYTDTQQEYFDRFRNNLNHYFDTKNDPDNDQK
jgi:integrase